MDGKTTRQAFYIAKQAFEENKISEFEYLEILYELRRNIQNIELNTLNKEIHDMLQEYINSL